MCSFSTNFNLSNKKSCRDSDLYSKETRGESYLIDVWYKFDELTRLVWWINHQLSGHSSGLFFWNFFLWPLQNGFIVPSVHNSDLMNMIAISWDRGSFLIPFVILRTTCNNTFISLLRKLQRFCESFSRCIVARTQKHLALYTYDKNGTK